MRTDSLLVNCRIPTSKTLFVKLKSQQRLVNLMFDEVKMVETWRYSGGHVLGYAENDAATGEHETLTSNAMVVEVKFSKRCCGLSLSNNVLRLEFCSLLESCHYARFSKKNEASILING